MSHKHPHSLTFRHKVVGMAFATLIRIAPALSSGRAQRYLTGRRKHTKKPIKVNYLLGHRNALRGIRLSRVIAYNTIHKLSISMIQREEHSISEYANIPRHAVHSPLLRYSAGNDVA